MSSDAVPPILPEYPEFSCAAVIVAAGARAQGLALGRHEHAP